MRAFGRYCYCRNGRCKVTLSLSGIKSNQDSQVLRIAGYATLLSAMMTNDPCLKSLTRDCPLCNLILRTPYKFSFSVIFVNLDRPSPDKQSRLPASSSGQLGVLRTVLHQVPSHSTCPGKFFHKRVLIRCRFGHFYVDDIAVDIHV